MSGMSGTCYPANKQQFATYLTEPAKSGSGHSFVPLCTLQGEQAFDLPLQLGPLEL